MEPKLKLYFSVRESVESQSLEVIALLEKAGEALVKERGRKGGMEA